jgi:DNA-binding MarR family transcriptional regulator
MTSRKRPASGQRSSAATPRKRFTPRQGQFLAFIHHFRTLHRCGPSELDVSRYFYVTPPAAHLMLVKLERLGLITREPGVPRSSRVVVPEEELPELEAVEGPPW